jgi:hypothetical protein
MNNFINYITTSENTNITFIIITITIIIIIHILRISELRNNRQTNTGQSDIRFR